MNTKKQQKQQPEDAGVHLQPTVIKTETRQPLPHWTITTKTLSNGKTKTRETIGSGRYKIRID